VLDHFRRFAAPVGDSVMAARMFRACCALYSSRELKGGAAYRSEVVHIREPAVLKEASVRFFGRAEPAPGYVPEHGRRSGED